jgi:hypothetical protein
MISILVYAAIAAVSALVGVYVGRKTASKTEATVLAAVKAEVAHLELAGETDAKSVIAKIKALF